MENALSSLVVPEEGPPGIRYASTVRKGSTIFLYGTDGREIGLGSVTTYRDGVPSFKQFYLGAWAYKEVFVYGAEAYGRLFPWTVCYARLDPWGPWLQPLVCAKVRPEGPLVPWLRELVKEVLS